MAQKKTRNRPGNRHRIVDGAVDEISLVPEGAVPDSDFVILMKSADAEDGDPEDDPDQEPADGVSAEEPLVDSSADSHLETGSADAGNPESPLEGAGMDQDPDGPLPSEEPAAKENLAEEEASALVARLRELSGVLTENHLRIIAAILVQEADRVEGGDSDEDSQVASGPVGSEDVKGSEPPDDSRLAAIEQQLAALAEKLDALSKQSDNQEHRVAKPRPDTDDRLAERLAQLEKSIERAASTVTGAYGRFARACGRDE